MLYRSLELYDGRRVIINAEKVTHLTPDGDNQTRVGFGREHAVLVKGNLDQTLRALTGS